MADYSRSDNESEDEQDDKSWEDYSSGKDAVIFLIEMSDGMIARQEAEDYSSYIQLALKCASCMYMNKVWSSSSDYVGVVLFGVGGAAADGATGSGGLHELQALQEPGPEPIQQLDGWSEDVQKLRSQVGISDDYSMTDALTHCSAMFSNLKSKLGSRRVLLLTCRDSPPDAASPHTRRRFIQKVADERDKRPRLDVTLFPLGDHFNLDTFYREALHDDDPEGAADAAEAPTGGGLHELLGRVRQRCFRKRVLGKIPWTLGNGVKLAVGVYNLVRSVKVPTAVRLDAATNKEVSSLTAEYAEGSDVPLLKSEINFCMSYGGRKIQFTSDEVRSLRTICEPGLVLLGFQPIAKLDTLLHVQPANFIYPEESWIKGSRAVFAALLRRCRERQVAPMCRLVSRRNDTPHLVALLPQPERRGADGLQTASPGFHVIYLPFADDIRQPPLPEPTRASDAQIAAARDVVTKLRFQYSPDKIENPQLQVHWRNIEALALEREQPDEFIDYTAPDAERIHRKAGSLIATFKELAFPDGGGDAASAPTPAKRPRRDPAAGADDVPALAKQGKVETLTMPILKEYLKSVGGSTAGKKAELVARVYEYCLGQ